MADDAPEPGNDGEIEGPFDAWLVLHVPKAKLDQMPSQKPEEHELGSGDTRVKRGRWKSLMDRERWPRKLWYPPMEEMEVGALNEGYKNCAQTVRRAMLTLLGLCLFTIVTVVGTPDRALVLGDAKIKIPFANADMVVGGFLFAIPLILIVVLAYLHVFLGHLKRLERTKGIGLRGGF